MATWIETLVVALAGGAGVKYLEVLLSKRQKDRDLARAERKDEADIESRLREELRKERDDFRKRLQEAETALKTFATPSIIVGDTGRYSIVKPDSTKPPAAMSPDSAKPPVTIEQLLDEVRALRASISRVEARNAALLDDNKGLREAYAEALTSNIRLDKETRDLKSQEEELRRSLEEERRRRRRRTGEP